MISGRFLSLFNLSRNRLLSWLSIYYLPPSLTRHVPWYKEPSYCIRNGLAITSAQATPNSKVKDPGPDTPR